MARPGHRGVSRRLSRSHRPTSGCGRPIRAPPTSMLNFFLLEKAFYEIEYELAHRPDWLRVPLAGIAPHPVANSRSRPHDQTARRGLCDHRGPPLRSVPLSRPAHAKATGTSCARSCPKPPNVEAIDEHGATRAAGAHPRRRAVRRRAAERLERLSAARALRRQRRRARRPLPLSADADRFRSLSARRRHPSADLRQARRASDDAGRRRRRRLRGAGAERPARQRGRRFQFLGRAAPSDAGARHRLLGAVRSRTPRVGDHYKFEIIGPRRPASAAEIRPDRVRRRGAAQDRLDRVRRGQIAASAPGAARHQRARRADVDLRGPSRLVAAQGQQ